MRNFSFLSSFNKVHIFWEVKCQKTLCTHFGFDRLQFPFQFEIRLNQYVCVSCHSGWFLKLFVAALEYMNFKNLWQIGNDFMNFKWEKR
jgi:hypothetical protein